MVGFIAIHVFYFVVYLIVINANEMDEVHLLFQPEWRLAPGVLFAESVPFDVQVPFIRNPQPRIKSTLFDMGSISSDTHKIATSRVLGVESRIFWRRKLEHSRNSAAEGCGGGVRGALLGPGGPLRRVRPLRRPGARRITLRILKLRVAPFSI